MRNNNSKPMKILLFFLRLCRGGGQLLRTINWKLHWRAMQLTTVKMRIYQVRSTCYLSTIYIFFSRPKVQTLEKNTLNIFCQPGKLQTMQLTERIFKAPSWEFPFDLREYVHFLVLSVGSFRDITGQVCSSLRLSFCFPCEILIVNPFDGRSESYYFAVS